LRGVRIPGQFSRWRSSEVRYGGTARGMVLRDLADLVAAPRPEASAPSRRGRPPARASIVARALVLGAVLAAAAACTGTGAPAVRRAPSVRPAVTRSGQVVVRAEGDAVALVRVSAASLGCPQAAQLLHYPAPCPAAAAGRPAGLPVVRVHVRDR
jgi:hypothetical protein